MVSVDQFGVPITAADRSQTLLSAAEKSGQRALARALLNERLELRPRSILNQRWMERVKLSTI